MLAYNSVHCFDIERIIPPTKAAQLEIPATSPNTKNIGKDDFELTFINSDNPNLVNPMKPKIINN
ncbi:MAG: hypothetical protein AAB526_01025, partial [Patescibacteria group bacterium]